MLAPEQIDRLYATFPGFRSLNADNRQTIEDKLTIAVTDRGRTLFRTGDICAGFLLCLSGGFNVMSTSGGNRKLVLQTVLPGASCTVSTLALMGNRPYLATAVAASHTEWASLPEAVFRTLMDTSPDFRRVVLSDYLSLLPSVMSLLDKMAFSRVDQRLAGSLLEQASPSGHVIKTHQQIATDIGTVREIVTHQLSYWSHAGWVKTMRGAVQILNRGALSGYLAEPSLIREQQPVLLTARLI